jgi:hypothetical protein
LTKFCEANLIENDINFTNMGRASRRARYRAVRFSPPERASLGREGARRAAQKLFNGIASNLLQPIYYCVTLIATSLSRRRYPELHCPEPDPGRCAE